MMIVLCHVMSVIMCYGHSVMHCNVMFYVEGDSHYFRLLKP